MKVLVVYAHHEPSSLTASMKNIVVQQLTELGHEVIVSDLYAQGFNAIAQKWDFVTTTGGHFNYMLEQRHAARLGMSFAPDITSEIEKIATAELVVIATPIWWFSVPAVLKGWFDRVLAMGVTWDGGKIYENGLMRGKQAMMVVSAGGPKEYYSKDGKHRASMTEILHPVNHGTLAFCGYDVHEPFSAINTLGQSKEEIEATLNDLRFRLKNLTTSPNWLTKY